MLDPQRVGLNAASVGFLQRTGQKVDWGAFNKALQTDDCVKVRRELKETPISEVHVMGGELFGFAGNAKTNELERQRTQINGYVLRAFDASHPAVVLPKKYGGFPTYVKNAAEGNYVSVFCEPLSAPLQKDTELLGRQGGVALSNSASKPYEPQGFITPLTNNKAEVINNRQLIEIRRTALIQSKKAQEQKFNVGVNASGHAYYDNAPDYDENGVPDDPLVASDPKSIVTIASIAQNRSQNAFQKHTARQYILQNRNARNALVEQRRNTGIDQNTQTLTTHPRSIRITPSTSVEGEVLSSAIRLGQKNPYYTTPPASKPRSNRLPNRSSSRSAIGSTANRIMKTWRSIENSGASSTDLSSAMSPILLSTHMRRSTRARNKTQFFTPSKNK
jgi:hypothetical protein